MENTEQTPFRPQTDWHADRRMDKAKPVYSPFNFVESGGIMNCVAHT